MCQLLGMSGNQPTDIVFSFSGFATRSSEHADGFCIAFFEGRGLLCVGLRGGPVLGDVVKPVSNLFQVECLNVIDLAID